MGGRNREEFINPPRRACGAPDRRRRRRASYDGNRRDTRKLKWTPYSLRPWQALARTILGAVGRGAGATPRTRARFAFCYLHLSEPRFNFTVRRNKLHGVVVTLQLEIAAHSEVTLFACIWCWISEFDLAAAGRHLHIDTDIKPDGLFTKRFPGYLKHLMLVRYKTTLWSFCFINWKKISLK